MTHKKCKKCNILKAIESFHKDKSRKDGLLDWCKNCKIQSRIEWSKENKDKDSISKKRYVIKHNAELSIKRKKFIEENPQYFALKAKEYRLRHRENISIKRKENDKNKRQIDPFYKLRRATSNSISSAIVKRGYTKKSKTQLMLGCDWAFFKNYIESRFLPGMTWQNYGIGGWSIDHICPCAQAQNEEELIKLQHYTNLEPSFNNFVKSDKATIEAILKCKEILGRSWL
jgi:hypothetical protein